MIRKALAAIAVVLAALMTLAAPAEANHDPLNRHYAVGVDKVIVKTQYLPSVYHAPLKEAAALLNRYTTSKIVVQKYCGSANFCVTMRKTDDASQTAWGAMATTWIRTTAQLTNGSVWNGWMGNNIYVLHRYNKDLGRWRLRGAFAHELGHVLTLQHDYKMSNGAWNKPPSVMGNNGQGSKRYFSVADKNYLGYVSGGTWKPYPSDRQILKKF